MNSFTFDLPTRVTFGSGAIDSVPGEAARCGSRALLLTGSTFARRSGLVERLASSLQQSGVETVVYEATEPHPNVLAIDAAARRARESRSEMIIGLGGGGTLDTAKGAAVGAYSGRPVWELTLRGNGAVPEIQGALPLVLIPIIASTGSETNCTAVLFNEEERVRVPISSPHLYARSAIVDPTLTFTVPNHYMAVGAMNIISQMLETYLTSDEFSVTDRVTEGLIRAVMDNVARADAHADDLDARSNLCWAAALASSLAQGGRGGATPLRAMAYALTARFPLEHGQALSALWPSFMRYALSNRLRLPHIGRFKRYALLGRQIFGVHDTDDEVAAEMTSYRFTAWLRSMKMPTRLLEADVDPEVLDEVATQAVTVSGNGKRLPSGLTVEDVQNIYEGALRPE
jgi:alcohol dehydrogenase class IV